MVRATRHNHNDIKSALKKLKDESNAKELQLIELVANMYENLKETKDHAVETAHDTCNNVNTSVHMHPWSYIGGAALVGFLAGMFLRR
jgi:ElaB/YqjD/DUF883 family membrane-anchored ribosome-binding protein